MFGIHQGAGGGRGTGQKALEERKTKAKEKEQRNTDDCVEVRLGAPVVLSNNYIYIYEALRNQKIPLVPTPEKLFYWCLQHVVRRKSGLTPTHSVRACTP